MQATKIEIAFNIILYLIIFLISNKALLKKSDSKGFIKTRKLIVLLLVLVFFVFGFYGGDYFHMKEDFHNIKAGYTEIEYPYIFIANFLSFNYTSFRLVVWGVMLFFIAKMYNRLSYSSFPLFVLAILFTLNLSYARVGLAMAMMFFGSSMILSPKKNKLLAFLFGFAFIFFSYFFHKSALFGLFVLLLSFIIRKVNKTVVIIALLSIPILVLFSKSLMDSFLLDASSVENVVDVERGLYYMNNEYASSFGLGMIIQNSLTWSSYYLTALLVLLLIFTNRYPTLDSTVQFYGNTTLFIVVIATGFGLIDFGVNTNLFYYRFLNFAMIPMCFFLGYCMDKGINKKLIRFILFMGFTGSLYSLLYRYYLAV